MSLDGAKSDTDEDKISLMSVDIDGRDHSSIATTPVTKLTEPKTFEISHSSLSVPNSAPIRPLSPDIVSDLSVDEYEQLQPSSESHNGSRLSLEGRNPKGWKGKIEQFWFRNKGLAFMLLAMVFAVLMNVTTRLLEVEGNKGQGLHPAHILFARMSITMVLASFYMWYNKTPYFPFGMPEVRWLLIARGLGGSAGVFGMYYSLLYLPLADATVITFLAPSIACWACSILINEPFTRIEQIGGLVSLVGVLLIARPTSLFTLSGDAGSSPMTGDTTPAGNSTAPPDASSYEGVTPRERLTGVGVALVGVLGTAVVYVVIRWIGKRAHPLITVNYFATWCVVVTIVAQSALPGVGWLLPAEPKEWGYLLFLGTCGFTMQFLLAAGLAYERSSRATNMTYTQMLFALFFDKLIFGHTPGAMSILGSSLILGSAITVALQKDPGKQQQKDSTEGSNRDEESRAGLISGARDVETAEDHDRLPVQEVQMRTLR